MMIVLTVVFITTLVWAALIEPRSFQINRYAISLSKPLSRKLRILHLSDMHIAGNHPHLKHFFSKLSKQVFDLVFISGDIIDHHKGIPHAADYLSSIPSKLGTFAVFGNHDYFNYELRDTFKFVYHAFPKGKNPIDQLESALTSKGIRVLKNDSLEVRTGEDSVWIHGLDDPTTGRGDFKKVRSNLVAGKINLLLTHSIDAFYHLQDGDVDVSVSGHSHGGQIRFPFLGPIVTHTRLGKAYADGLKMLKGAVCSISRGLHSGRYLWIRFLCPPEAIILELEGSHSAGATARYRRVDSADWSEPDFSEKIPDRF